MQYRHEQYRQLAREHLDEAIDRNTRDHNKKAYPRQFHEGELVLLEVKNSKAKTKKYQKFIKGHTSL
jgi:ribosomal protein L21E